MIRRRYHTTAGKRTILPALCRPLRGVVNGEGGTRWLEFPQSYGLNDYLVVSFV